MISQYDVTGCLMAAIPSLSLNEYPERGSLHVYATVNYFTDYTRQAIQLHRLDTAKQCFALAEKLYCEGDRLVRLLIENSFVYAITSFLSVNGGENEQVRAMIPKTLYAAYMRQVGHNGY